MVLRGLRVGWLWVGGVEGSRKVTILNRLKSRGQGRERIFVDVFVGIGR